MQFASRFSLGCVALVFSALCATPAAAQTVVYDNGVLVRDITLTPASDRSTDPGLAATVYADNIYLSQSSVVNQVRWYGGYLLGNTPTAQSDNFTISFYETSANGNAYPVVTPFASFAIGSPGRTLTAFGVGCGRFGCLADVYEYKATLPSRVNFSAGIYAISIVNDTALDTDDFWYWGAKRDDASRLYTRGLTPTNWAAFPNQLAFQLELVAAPVTTVPEPSSLLLMGFGIAAVGFGARRQRAI